MILPEFLLHWWKEVNKVFSANIEIAVTAACLMG